MISIQETAPLQDTLTRAWHGQVDPEAGQTRESGASGVPNEEKVRQEWLELVTRNHRANFDLWHIEDEARRPGTSDGELAAVKRRIDVTNQLRNDVVESIDQFLLGWLRGRGLPNPDAPLHSETPALIVDRLSILSLKIYHTHEEIERKHAPAGHAARNRERLAILEKQRRDLVKCLIELWQEVLVGTRRFEVYRQLKMYNDPTLNPAIYRKIETP
jgi:hypothetical protein